ncbi:MAG: hypothetical protein WCH99_04850 [Verrucomicrobiota bacterium]
MKKTFLLIATGLLTAVSAVRAQSSIPLTVYPLTNATITAGAAAGIATASSSNILSQPFQIWRGRGFTFNAAFYCTNASGSNVQMTLRYAARHKIPGTSTVVTNWITSGTAAPMTFNTANNGTTEVFFSTNIPPAIIDNVDLGQFYTMTNQHTATLFLDPTNTFIGVFP